VETRCDPGCLKGTTMSCDSDTMSCVNHPAGASAGDRVPTNSGPPAVPASVGRYIIYGLEELASGRHYVGLTRRSLNERIRSHLNQARRDRRVRPGGLIAALRLMESLGQTYADCFASRILAYAKTAEEARVLERLWVDRLESRKPSGLNDMPGGSSVGGVENAQPLSVTGSDGVPRIYPSIGQAIAACNDVRASKGQPRLEPSTVYARLAAGWTTEEALSVKPRRHFGSVRRSLALGDEVYSTLLEASEATGVPRTTLSSRLHRLKRAGLAGVPQIGQDRRAGRTSRAAPLDIPWPGTTERLTAAAFAARVGLPKATIIHRWHRARGLAGGGVLLSSEDLHAFLTMSARNTCPGPGAADRLVHRAPAPDGGTSADASERAVRESQ